MVHFGTLELIILLVIVILLFGVGRIGKIAKELGNGIRDFRSGISGLQDEVAAKTNEESKEP